MFWSQNDYNESREQTICNLHENWGGPVCNASKLSQSKFTRKSSSSSINLDTKKCPGVCGLWSFIWYVLWHMPSMSSISTHHYMIEAQTLELYKSWWICQTRQSLKTQEIVTLSQIHCVILQSSRKIKLHHISHKLAQ